MAKCILVIVCLVSIGILSVESLIGLRPPQHKHKPKEEKRPADGSTSKGSLSLTYKHPKDVNVCYLPELFRCSSILVQRSVWNEASPCNRINAFSRCSASALSRETRHHYISGVTLLRTLTQPFYKNHGCPTVNMNHNQTHLRHSHSKDTISDACCITTLLKCSVQVFMDSTRTPRPSKCNIMSSYKQCLYSSSSTCHWKSFLDNFPALASSNLNCHS